MNKRNENREGFKETKVGWIPEDWKYSELNLLGSFTNGINKDKDDFGFGSPILNLQDVFGKSRITRMPVGLVDATKSEIERYDLKRGDVIFVRSSVKPEGVGLTSVIFENLPETVYSGFLIRFRPKRDVFDNMYLRYCFYQFGFRKELLRRSTISANTNINQVALKSLGIPIPTFHEQQKIAEILNTWDQAIELIEKQIEVKKRLKKGLMQQLLTGKMRFPGFKEEWKIEKLGDVFSERNENNPSLDLLSITSNEGVIPRDEVGRKDTSSDDKSNYKVILPGDIGYNTMRMWQGRSAVSSLKGIVSPAYTIVTPKKNHDVIFLGYLFQLPQIIHLFYQYSQGLVSDTWSLKFPNFSQIKIRIPQYEEQRQIAKVLLQLDKEIRILQNKITALQKQKQGMMQKLLTGEVRVKV